MTMTQGVLTVLMVVLGTMLTRFLPFLVFPAAKTPPPSVRYLGTVLPPAVMGMLIVYCLRDSFTGAHHGIPELAGILFTVALHAWKRNMLLSIGVGTVFYMLLVQTWWG